MPLRQRRQRESTRRSGFLTFDSYIWTSLINSDSTLTLPGVNPRGFLIHRVTFKRCVLAASLKLFNRAIAPIDELNSQPPLLGLSPKAYYDTNLGFGCAPPYLIETNY